MRLKLSVFGCHRNQMIFCVSQNKGCQIADMLGFEGVGTCMFFRDRFVWLLWWSWSVE